MKAPSRTEISDYSYPTEISASQHSFGSSRGGSWHQRGSGVVARASPTHPTKLLPGDIFLAGGLIPIDQEAQHTECLIRLSARTDQKRNFNVGVHRLLNAFGRNDRLAGSWCCVAHLNRHFSLCRR